MLIWPENCKNDRKIGKKVFHDVFLWRLSIGELSILNIDPNALFSNRNRFMYFWVKTVAVVGGDDWKILSSNMHLFLKN
jgi:hypothetical protein